MGGGGGDRGKLGWVRSGYKASQVNQLLQLHSPQKLQHPEIFPVCVACIILTFVHVCTYLLNFALELLPMIFTGRLPLASVLEGNRLRSYSI